MCPERYKNEPMVSDHFLFRVRAWKLPAWLLEKLGTIQPGPLTATHEDIRGTLKMLPVSPTMVPMSAAEILNELPKLTSAELQHIHERILELEEAQQIEETPELLAAVDEGLRSLENERTYTLDEARAKITDWTSKSS
jgi:hypothetical protein